MNVKKGVLGSRDRHDPLAPRRWLFRRTHESFAQHLGLSSTGRDGPPSRPPGTYGRPECLSPSHRSFLHTGPFTP
jgi:hypothetical protein